MRKTIYLKMILRKKDLMFILYELFDELLSNQAIRVIVNNAGDQRVDNNIYVDFGYSDFSMPRYKVWNLMVVLKKLKVVEEIVEHGKGTKFKIYVFRFFDELLPILPEIKQRLKNLKII
jgi:hypothetical protein